MKKNTFCLVLMLVSIFLLAQQPTPVKEAIINSVELPLVQRDYHFRNDAPHVEFVINPVPLLENYSSYFSGGYNRLPLVLQPEISYPYMYPAGGLYLAFHARETADSYRRIHYTYINSEGVPVQSDFITTDNEWVGFPGIDMDTISGNPFVAYHGSVAGSANNWYLTYDVFNQTGQSGNWATPINITDELSDDFIWSKEVAITPSPIENKQRIFICGETYVEGTQQTIIGKADFDDNTLSLQDFEFEFSTIPELLELNNTIGGIAFQTLTTSDDGQVALVGFYSHHGEPGDPTSHKFIMIHSEDYGENYSFYETDATIPTWNPQNLDGSYHFIDPVSNVPYEDDEIFFCPGSTKHVNAIFSGENSKIVLPATMVMTAYNGFYYPLYSYPAVLSYQLQNNELQVDVSFLQYSSSPWDLNNDGTVDQYLDDGTVHVPISIPSYLYVDGDWSDIYFHEGYLRITGSENWLIAMWQDATNIYYANIDENYEDWEATPQIVISASGDNGQTWSEPAFMNAKPDDDNFYSELEGMIPAYLYPANQLEIMNDNKAKMHIFFTDNYTYNPEHSSAGMNYYAALNIELPFSSLSNNEIASHTNSFFSNNYPNPFNPSTTIQFDMAEAGRVSLEIFNIKGQKVETLVNEYLPAGRHEFMWEGKSHNDKHLSSGIYLYKLLMDDKMSSRKMLLLK